MVPCPLLHPLAIFRLLRRLPWLRCRLPTLAGCMARGLWVAWGGARNLRKARQGVSTTSLGRGVLLRRLRVIGRWLLQGRAGRQALGEDFIGSIQVYTPKMHRNCD